MTTTDPRQVSAQRRRAVNVSWARTPNRAERTKNGFIASPMSLDYWIAKTEAAGIVRPEDRLAAAQNAHSAYQSEMSLRAVKAKQAKAKAAQRRRPQ